MTGSIPHIQQFIYVFIFLVQHVFADDADIRGPVFHIGGQIHGLDDDKFYLGVPIGNDQFPGIFHYVFCRIADFGQKFHRLGK